MEGWLSSAGAASLQRLLQLPERYSKQELLGEECGGICGIWRRANGSFERRKKHLAGGCSCESGCLGQACGTVYRFQRGQTAALNTVQNTWLGPVAGKVVALDRPAGRFRGFKAGGSFERPQKRMAEACAAKVVALKRPVSGVCGVRGVCGFWRRASGSFERRTKHLAGACSWESGCLGQACGTV